MRTFAIVTALAVGLAVVLFVTGHPSPIYDSYGYYVLAQRIAAHGLDGAANDVRTCGYPLFIAAFTGFRRLSPEAVRLVLFPVQLALFLGACAIAARAFGRVFESRRVAGITYAAAALNPFLLARTTEVLSDLISAVLVLLAVVLTVQPRGRYPVASAAGALSLAALAVVVRPANLPILAAVAVAWIVRARRERSIPISALPILLAAAIVPFVPQIVINSRAFGKASPLVVSHLYRDQAHWGMANLKYATSVVPGKPPQIVYANPLYRGDASPPAFLSRSPVGYVATLALHLFAMLDHDFLFTLVTDLHPPYRWPLATANFAFLALGAWGIRLAWRSPTSPEARFATGVIVFACVLYLGIHLAIAVESRFSLPVDLLLTPFFAIAVIRIGELWTSGRWAAVARVVLATAVTVAIALALSGWISAQATRGY